MTYSCPTGLASPPQPPSPAGTARSLQNAALEAHRQNETSDVVARPRVRTERSADLKLRHQDAQQAIRGTQGPIERTRFADEGHRAVNRRVRGGDTKVVADVGIGLDTTVGRFEDERRERIVGAGDLALLVTSVRVVPEYEPRTRPLVVEASSEATFTGVSVGAEL